MCFLELQAPLSKSLERVWNCFTSGHAILWRYRLVVGYSSRCRPVDIKVTSFHDIFFLHAVLISNKGENTINIGIEVLFHLSKYYDKLYGNIVKKIQFEMSSFIQVWTSLVFATISEFWNSGFSKLTMPKLMTCSAFI